MNNPFRLALTTFGIILAVIITALAWRGVQRIKAAAFVPVDIPVGSARVAPQFANGWDTAVLLAPDGTLWQLWRKGNNAAAAGKGHWLQPRQIDAGTNWVGVTAGWLKMVALRDDGTLWSWSLPNPSSVDMGFDGVPAAQVGSAAEWAALASGHSGHFLALKRDGSLWTWGNNNSGQLGDGTKTDSDIPLQVGTNSDWVAMSAGAFHSAGVRADGSLWVWGRDKLSGPAGIPAQVGEGTDWRSVHAGDFHTIGIIRAGRSWVWGSNLASQLDGGTTATITTPIACADASDWRITAGGGMHQLILKTDGSLWAFGVNNLGELGNGTTIASKEPVRVGDRNDWVSVVAHGAVSMGTTADGGVWSWGIRDYEPGRVPSYTRVIAPIIRLFDATHRPQPTPAVSVTPRLIGRFVPKPDAENAGPAKN